MLGEEFGCVPPCAPLSRKTSVWFKNHTVGNDMRWTMKTASKFLSLFRSYTAAGQWNICALHVSLRHQDVGLVIFRVLAKALNSIVAGKMLQRSLDSVQYHALNEVGASRHLLRF